MLIKIAHIKRNVWIDMKRGAHTDSKKKTSNSRIAGLIRLAEEWVLINVSIKKKDASLNWMQN